MKKKPLTASEMAIRGHNKYRKEMGEKKYKEWMLSRFKSKATQSHKTEEKVVHS